MQGAVEYLGHIYYVVCVECFFSAVGHIDYHPCMHIDPNPQSPRPTNPKRSRRRACLSCKLKQYFDLSTYKIEYLSKLKVASLWVNMKFHHNIMKTHHRVTSKRVKKPYYHNHMKFCSREKWFSLLTWLSGWGVSVNVRNVRKIEENFQMLQNQKESQIPELTHYLNLTMIQVWENHGVLCKLMPNC